jgi:hypothetical protein
MKSTIGMHRIRTPKYITIETFDTMVNRLSFYPLNPVVRLKKTAGPARQPDFS